MKRPALHRVFRVPFSRRGLLTDVEDEVRFHIEGRIEELIADGFITDGEEEGDFGDAFPHLRYRQTVRASSPSGLHEVTGGASNDFIRQE